MQKLSHLIRHESNEVNVLLQTYEKKEGIEQKLSHCCTLCSCL